MSEAPFRRILVAVDGTPGSERAVRAAARLAAATGARVTLLHVGPLREHELLVADDELARHHEDGTRVLEEGVHLLAAQGVQARTELRRGRPPEEILRYAARESPDLIVLGTRGLTGARRVLLGSVSRAVAAEAGCAVLLVR